MHDRSAHLKTRIILIAQLVHNLPERYTNVLIEGFDEHQKETVLYEKTTLLRLLDVIEATISVVADSLSDIYSRGGQVLG